MPWQEKDTLKLRYEFVQRIYSGEKLANLCREYEISRPTGYLWLKRYKDSPGIESLHNRPRRPKSTPSKIDKEVEDKICCLRAEYGWGGKKLSELLKREGIVVPTVTVNRVIKRNGLLLEKDCHRQALQRFERSHPNELWQIDFKGPMSKGSAKCEPLTVLDDHSRYAIGVVPVKTKQTAEIKSEFVKIFSKYGVPEAILMDHGVPWWSNSNLQGLSKFSVWLMNQDLKLLFGAIRHPQTQGKVERFHRTLSLAVRTKGEPNKFSQWKSLLEKIKHEYNFIRPHEALNMKVPADYYCRSMKDYNPRPRKFDYSEKMQVKKVDSLGRIHLRNQRLFVCHALAGQYVGLEQIENLILVKYRNSMIREINLTTGRTKATGSTIRNLDKNLC